MDKNNIKRVRNILSGDYTGKTLTSIGYKKKDEKYVEGDVWEENGKKWTIKNGIKRNITKLDNVRHVVRMPLTCPSCHNIMRKRLDKKMWNLRGKCFDCVIIEDTEKIKDGSFKKYEKEVISKNMNSYLNQVKDFFEDYLDKLDSKHFVTEQGDIEDWQSGFSKKQLKEMFSTQVKEFKEKVEEYKNLENENE